MRRAPRDPVPRSPTASNVARAELSSESSLVGSLLRHPGTKDAVSCGGSQGSLSLAHSVSLHLSIAAPLLSSHGRAAGGGRRATGGTWVPPVASMYLCACTFASGKCRRRTDPNTRLVSSARRQMGGAG